jgi:hypothetical protein
MPRPNEPTPTLALATGTGCKHPSTVKGAPKAYYLTIFPLTAGTSGRALCPAFLVGDNTGQLRTPIAQARLAAATAVLGSTARNRISGRDVKAQWDKAEGQVHLCACGEGRVHRGSIRRDGGITGRMGGTG